MAKKTALENLARMIKAGLDETATKTELKNVEDRLTGKIDRVEGRVERVEGDIKILRQDMEAGFYTLAQEIKQLREDFQAFISIYKNEIADLRARIERLEKKVGIKK